MKIQIQPKAGLNIQVIDLKANIEHLISPCTNVSPSSTSLLKYLSSQFAVHDVTWFRLFALKIISNVISRPNQAKKKCDFLQKVEAGSQVHVQPSPDISGGIPTRRTMRMSIAQSSEIV